LPLIRHLMLITTIKDRLFNLRAFETKS